MSLPYEALPDVFSATYAYDRALVQLERDLEALPEGSTIEVTKSSGEIHQLVRCPGGWWLRGDLVVASGDIAWGYPERVVVSDG